MVLLVEFCNIFCNSLLSLFVRGGISKGQGFAGENGTITGKDCPKGLYGTFCKVAL